MTSRKKRARLNAMTEAINEKNVREGKPTYWPAEYTGTRKPEIEARNRNKSYGGNQ